MPDPSCTRRCSSPRCAPPPLPKRAARATLSVEMAREHLPKRRWAREVVVMRGGGLAGEGVGPEGDGGLCACVGAEGVAQEREREVGGWV